MSFENGYPVGDSIKPALYINDPQQTHDLLQVSFPFRISQWLSSLMDTRHHFHGISSYQDAYIIERYTEEDYAYAYDFSLKLYKFYQYLSELNSSISPFSAVGKISGLTFGDRFSKQENIDSSTYKRDFENILKINLPNTDNENDWITITLYETLPWIVDEFWTYSNVFQTNAIDRVSTLLTKNDIALLEIPDSRESNSPTGSRIEIPTESPYTRHYIQIDYKYRFHAQTTESCIVDPFTRRYNLVNRKYKTVGQEISLNTRWLVAYTIVVDSNNSSIKDAILEQIPEQYLYENFDSYLDLLKTEVDNQYISKKILTNVNINIDFKEEVSLYQKFIKSAALDESGFVSKWDANHNISVSYQASEPSLSFTDINPEAHYYGNLIYANNNLFNNKFGNTSDYLDLGVGLHIERVREKTFRFDYGTIFTRNADSLAFGSVLKTSASEYNIYSPNKSEEGLANTGLYQERGDYPLETEHSEEGKYSLAHDKQIRTLQNLKAYRISHLVASFLNSSLYSEAKVPFFVYADLGVRFRNLPEGGYGFESAPLTIKIDAIVSLDENIGENLSEISGEIVPGRVDGETRSTQSSSARTFFGLVDGESNKPDGFLSSNVFFPTTQNEEFSADFSLNETFSHTWELSAYGVVRTTSQARDFSRPLAREEENINAFNKLFFEECSCMSAQIAQEILDLVREIHAATDAGKYAYQADGETKRVANLGYLVERMARVLGVSVNPDGSIRSIRQSKLIETGDEIPAGWNLGQWGRNQGGSSVGQTGGSANEDRDGLAYAVRSNSFTLDPFTGEPNLIKEGGYVLVENLPQLLHLILDDLDRAIGFQNAGANVVPSPNGELIPIQGMNNILLQILYTVGQTNKSNIASFRSSFNYQKNACTN